jgi:F0F1-type ATP synthase delta subunit
MAKKDALKPKHKILTGIIPDYAKESVRKGQNGQTVVDVLISPSISSAEYDELKRVIKAEFGKNLIEIYTRTIGCDFTVYLR